MVDDRVMAQTQVHRTTLHNMAKAVTVSGLKADLAKVDGFNAKVAVLLTKVVGTMWCFWAFNGIALVSLPAAIQTHSLTVLINWVSSNWIQLILLPALMVGQALQNVAADARADRTFSDVEKIIDALDTRTQGGLQEVMAALDELKAKLAG
jgi:hypothetical protein